MNTTMHSTQRSQSTAATIEKPWRGIFFRGPQVAKTNTGSKVSTWSVYQGDDQGQPAGRIYEIKDFMRAHNLAQNMSNDRELELINEAVEDAA